MQIDAMGVVVRLEHELLEVAAAWSEAAVDFVVLKGAATAHLDYPDPSLRQFGDVDVLVGPEHFAEAGRVLEAIGWEQAYVLPRHHHEFTHARTFRGAAGLEVDLHQRLAHRAIGELMPGEVVLAARRRYVLAQKELYALGDEDRLIHAALHAATSRGEYRRLSSVADVLVMTQHQRREARAVLDRADEFALRRIVWAGITSAYSEADLPVPAEWTEAAAIRPARRERFVEHAYLSARRRPVLEELAYLRQLHGWRRRFRYLGGYFAVDEGYARQNNRLRRRDQMRYLWSRIRSG